MEAVTSTHQSLEEANTALGNLFFELGRLYYQIELQKSMFADLEIKVRNQNKKSLELQQKMQKEQSEIKLAPPPTEEGAESPKLEGIS